MNGDLRWAWAEPGWRRWHVVVALPDGRYSLALCGRRPPPNVPLTVREDRPNPGVVCKLCSDFAARRARTER